MDQIPGSQAQRTITMKRTHSKAIQYAIAAAIIIGATLAGAGNNVTQQIVYSATSGGGLVKGGTTAAPSFGLIRTCSSTQVLKWNGSAWACAADADSGGDITGVTTAGILTGGCTSGTCALTTSVATSRVLGRTTAGSGVVEELTSAQTTALLDLVTTSAKGLVPTAPNDTSKFFRGDGTWAVPGVTAGSVGIAWFGDGSDGDATMDGVNDYAAIGISKGTDPTPAQGLLLNYYSLSRDTYFHNLTINSGQNLFTGSFRLFVTGTLTLNTGGTVGCWGNDGTAGDGTGTGGAGGPQRNQFFLGGAGAGGVGRRGATGNGGGGAPPGNAPRGFSNSPGGTGKGGVGGGTGTSNGGTITIVSSAQSGDLHNLEQAIVGNLAWSTSKFGGGSGGGGGGGANGTYGGGGGAGGCPTIIRAREITGGGKTVSFGGYGGAGFTNGSGTGGGGGGGGGGWVVVVVGTGSYPAYDITGGNAGTGVAPAAGAGGAGQIYQFNVGTP
jgi:hypothetical protein